MDLDCSRVEQRGPLRLESCLEQGFCRLALWSVYRGSEYDLVVSSLKGMRSGSWDSSEGEQ